jgi:Carboxypeptidase regulatory-like domain
MQLRLLIAGLLCAALTVGVGAMPRPAGLGTVAGQVLGSNGKAIAGARVTLQAAEGRRLQTTDTNDQGRFWFASLPEGQYDVRASYEGRVSEWRQNVWVAPGEQTDVVLHLGPKK